MHGRIDQQPVKAETRVTRRGATEECKWDDGLLWCSVDMSVNDCCRFCHKYLKIQGVISHSTKIFEATGKVKTVFDRLVQLGLTLTKTPEKSIRSCQKCTNLLSRIERDLPVFRRWESDEKNSNEEPSASTAADNGNREPSPSKTHRALKKLCPNPPTPSLSRISVSERRSVIETAPYEESCPGITFDVSEFTFDEENNCSNEAGQAEYGNNCSNEDWEEEIAISDSDLEKEDSDQLESDYSDRLESDGSDERDSNLDSKLEESVSHLCPECGAFDFTCKTHTCAYKINPFSCSVCDKRCTDESARKAHGKIHTESYEHLCKFCMAPFQTRLDKLCHEGTHIPCARPYKCPDCPMTFSKLPALNIHLDGHMGTKTFSCPHCSLDFPTVHYMNRHIVVHTGMKQFVCEFCSRSFDQPAHLESHLCVHTGENLFHCHLHKGVSASGPRGAAGKTNWIPAVQGNDLDPITTADPSGEGCLRRPSSKDIDSDWNDGDPTSELTERDKDEESKGVGKRKRKASQRPKSCSIAKKDIESDSSSPVEEATLLRQVVKGQETQEAIEEGRRIIHRK